MGTTDLENEPKMIELTLDADLAHNASIGSQSFADWRHLDSGRYHRRRSYDYCRVIDAAASKFAEGMMVLVILSMTISWPNKSPEPTAVGAVSSAVAVHVASRRWLSFFR